jgi:hypothetical protein
MPPKTPSELREQIEAQQNEPAAEGHERTAEGMETPTPSKNSFFGNLRKAANPLPNRKRRAGK